MARIPNTSEVKKAIRILMRSVNQTIKDVNLQAGGLVSRGDYSTAQTLVEVAKSMKEFGDDVRLLRTRWNEIIGQAKQSNRRKKEATTPLWEYYQPLLSALVELGGEASRGQLEKHLESDVRGILKEGDFVVNARGIPKWKVMVGRARKHMIQEGFLSDENILKWTITRKGEKASKAVRKS